MDFSRPLTDNERREIMRFIDDFLYHMEDNYCCSMEQNEELKKLNLAEICDKLNDAYHALEEACTK